MIKLINLSKSYGAQHLLDNVTFNINAKERIGVVGRNGHGKTTLFRLLLGQEEPDSGQVVKPKDYTVGYLEQHIRFTAETVLEEACLGLPKAREQETWVAKKILTGLGFQDMDFNRSPWDFSGGFQVRLNLAKVLINEPDLLLLDEPTNYLDIISVRWLTHYLRQWPKELMLITHDRSFMDKVATHILGIHRRSIRKMTGSTRKYFQQLMTEEEVYEKTRLNDEKKRKDTERFISRFRAKARLAGLVQSRVKALEKSQKMEQLEKIEDLDFRFQADVFPAKIMVELNDVSFRYDRLQHWLFEKLNLTIGKQDRVAIIGKNGKGKTTLLRLMVQELFPVEGTLKTHPALKCGYFGQTNIDRLQPELTVEEELILADPEQSRQRARDVAGMMMFSGEGALKKVKVLSGGERSRVLLGKLLLSPCHLLFLDEPTNHLDLESCQALLEALRVFPGSVVMVTHDELFLQHLATKLVVFNHDQAMVFNGAYAQYLNDVGWEDAQASEILAAATRGDTHEQLPDLKEADFSPVVSKKSLRQEKARRLQEKTRRLKPLELKMQGLETSIENLETELAANQQALITASMEADVAQLAALPKRNKEIEHQLEEMYGHLTEISETYEAMAKELEDHL